MIKKIAVSIVAVLALGAGAAYAATQLASSDATQVCVNQTNGLMRASSTCRDGEYPMTIGGGSELRVTQEGSFTVTGSATSTPVTLPLTGVQVSGKFEVQTPPPPYPEAGLARIVLLAPSGGTMDAFTTPGGVGTIGGTSLTTYPFVAYGGSDSSLRRRISRRDRQRGNRNDHLRCAGQHGHDATNLHVSLAGDGGTQLVQTRQPVDQGPPAWRPLRRQEAGVGRGRPLPLPLPESFASRAPEPDRRDSAGCAGLPRAAGGRAPRDHRARRAGRVDGVARVGEPGVARVRREGVAWLPPGSRGHQDRCAQPRGAADRPAHALARRDASGDLRRDRPDGP